MTTINGFQIFGAIEAKWLALGGRGSYLRMPLSNETTTFDQVGRFQQFEGGVVSWHPQTGAFVVTGAIAEKWRQIGAERYGYPITDELVCPDGRGRFNHFRTMHVEGRPECSIYWTAEIGAVEIFGSIRARWSSLGWETSALGYPVSPEASAFDQVGRTQLFQNGAVSWHPEIGTMAVVGLICARWRQIGAEKFGYPITDESSCPDGIGRYSHFRAMHLGGHPESSIHWTPATGAVETYGAIRARWIGLGWERGELGYPIAPESATFDGVGRKQSFQKGTLTWHPEIGAFAVLGAIDDRWHQIGAEKFGYPYTDESPCPDGQGRYNHFRAMHLAGRPEGSIHWTPATGAVETFGAIRGRWISLGSESGTLGYPVAPEAPTFDGAGRNQPFQHGALSWHPDHGAFAVVEAICARWRQLGAERFGYPVTDESPCPDGRGRYNHFRDLQSAGLPEASIYWTPQTGAVEVYGGIRDRWARRGWEESNMHYPLEPERDWPEGKGRQQRFEGGRIVWSAAEGALFDPLVLEAPIASGGVAALGGWCRVTIPYRGQVVWDGHAHDSGADGYTFTIVAAIATPSGMTVAFSHSGDVGGTFTSGSRDDDWREVHQRPAGVTTRELNDGVFGTNLEYSSEIGSAIESTVSWIAKFSIGTALSPVSGIVFVGVEAVSLIQTGSLVPGARIIAGTLWMAGPLNTLIAIAAENIVALGSRSRSLSYEEYSWANTEVFNGSLPPREDILVSEMIGVGHVAFTFPRFDGKIVLNMGPTAFTDARDYFDDHGIRGRTFIHELVHACQARYAPSGAAFVARAVGSSLRGQQAYFYSGPNVEYRSLNIEQQAQIVSDWFAGESTHGPLHTGAMKDVRSPYYKFITNNIWARAY